MNDPSEPRIFIEVYRVMGDKRVSSIKEISLRSWERSISQGSVAALEINGALAEVGWRVQ